MLGIKLKLENTTQQFQEETRVRMQVTDKYGEVQRELTRMREALDSGKLTVSELKRENSSLSAQVSELTQQSKSLSEAHSQLESKASRLTTELAKVKQQAQERLESAGRESEERVAALESELQSLQSRVSTEEESASLLDQYKKRAQAAIKKANDQIHELNIEVERLKIDLASAQESAKGDEGAAKQAALSIQRLEEELAASQTEVSLQSNRVTELEVALETAKSQANTRDQDNIAKITELTKALRSAESSSHMSNSSAASASASAATSTAPISPMKQNKSAVATAVSDSPASARSSNEDRHQEDGNEPRKESAPSTESQVEKIANRQLKHRAESHHHNPNSSPSTTDPQLFLVNELYSKLDELRKQVGATEQSNVELQSELVIEKEISRSLQVRAEELTAILDRNRQLRDDPDSQVNTEYLKNCIFKYMITTDPIDKLRLSNVVCAVLKLTDKEKAAVKEVLDRESSSLVSVGMDESLTSIASLATTSFESLFGTTSQGQPPVVNTVAPAQATEASASSSIIPTDLFSSFFSTSVRN